INNEKYSFLSQLQSHAIRTSTGKDVIVFNYADFVWCDGSLAKCIEPLRDKSKDAMLTFCLPVDEWAGKHALRDFRRPDADAIVLPSRTGAALAIDNLHREARLRIWDSEEFTSAPSYVLWRVGDQGLILHAYHMTVLALRVMPNDPSFIGGIKEGSLDGYYSGIVAERWPFAIADDSDAVLVFSLYDTTVDSRESTGLSREEVLRWTAIQASPSQRELVLHPILLKRHFDDPAAWSQATRASAEILRRIHDITDRFSSIAVAQFVQRLLPRIYALLGSDVGRLLKLLAGRSLRNLIRGVVIRAHVRSELRLAPGKSFKNAPAATAPTTWKGREPVDRTDQWSSAQWISLFASGQIEEILKTFDPMPEGVIIMPSISVSGAAAARLRAAKFIEGLIGNINEDQTIGAVLQTRDLMLSQAIQIEPQWPELSDWRAANSFMIGRFSAATEDFNTAEAKRRTMALHAKLDPDKAVYLPRSCAFSIGLMTHFDGYVKHKILSGDQRPYLLLTNASSVVNPVFLSYWRDHIEVVTNSATVARLEQEEPALSPNWNWVLPGGDGRVDHIHKRIAAVQRQWEAEQRDPLLTLRESQRQALDEQKRQWGMSEDDWFVCLHVRSAG